MIDSYLLVLISALLVQASMLHIKLLPRWKFEKMVKEGNINLLCRSKIVDEKWPLRGVTSQQASWSVAPVFLVFNTIINIL